MSNPQRPIDFQLWNMVLTILEARTSDRVMMHANLSLIHARIDYLSRLIAKARGSDPDAELKDIIDTEAGVVDEWRKIKAKMEKDDEHLEAITNDLRKMIKTMEEG